MATRTTSVQWQILARQIPLFALLFVSVLYWLGDNLEDRLISASLENARRSASEVVFAVESSMVAAGSHEVWDGVVNKVLIHEDTVIVSSPEVAQPVAVRYAWAMNPSQRNLLYNKEGIPASPFRTDDWPLFQPDAEIVEVVKPAKPEVKTSVDWQRPLMTQ